MCGLPLNIEDVRKLSRKSVSLKQPEMTRVTEECS